MPEDLSPFNLTAISAADKETITIGTTNGDIAPVKRYIVVAAFSGTADNLDRIETSGILTPGDADGAVIYLRADAGDTITIRHNQDAGQHYNILTETGGSVTMTGNTIVRCVYDINLDTDGAWVVPAQSGTAIKLIDADLDTQVQVEESADEDVIRFDAAGAELMTIGQEGAVDMHHTAAAANEHALEIEVDAAAKGDIIGLNLSYVTGAIAGGQDEEGILVNIDESAATGGDVTALEVLTTEGSATIIGMEAAAQVNPIFQLAGQFEDMDVALVKTTDRLTEFLNAGNDIVFFVDNADTITIGDADQFEEIEFLLATAASVSVKPKFEFSITGSAWTEFFPADGTNGMRNSGLVFWLLADISATWAKHGSEFLIRITREKATVQTDPIESKVQIVKGIQYEWTKEGDLIIRYICPREQTGPRSSTAGLGQIYVKDDAPNTLHFVDDAANDRPLYPTEYPTDTVIAATDLVPYVDVSETPDAANKILFSGFESALNHDNLTGFVAGEHLVWATSGVGTVHINNIDEASVTAQGVVELATAAETNAGSLNTRALTPLSASSPDRTIILTASGGIGTTTNPAAGPLQIETSTNQVNYWVLDFDAGATEEHAFWNVVMPDNWDAGTITFRYYWISSATDTDGVSLGLRAVCISDNEVIDSAFGTAVVLDDDNTATDASVNISAESGAVTVANAVAGELVIFDVYRDTDDSNDVMAEDMRLIQVRITYGTDLYSD